MRAANDANNVPDVALRFANQWYDLETGLHYNYQRYYDPDTGQYCSPDPIGIAGGLRQQGYVHDPSGWVDPVGLSGCGGTVRVFRVQGGTPPKASKHLITLDHANNPVIKQGTLNISIGTKEHAEYYLSQRQNATVVSFEIPKWLGDFIHENSVPQLGYKSNPLNQNGNAPKLVDPTTPGKSYELPPIWASWLQENAIAGSGRIGF